MERFDALFLFLLLGHVDLYSADASAWKSRLAIWVDSTLLYLHSSPLTTFLVIHAIHSFVVIIHIHAETCVDIIHIQVETCVDILLAVI